MLSTIIATFFLKSNCIRMNQIQLKARDTKLIFISHQTGKQHSSEGITLNSEYRERLVTVPVL